MQGVSQIHVDEPVDGLSQFSTPPCLVEHVQIDHSLSAGRRSELRRHWRYLIAVVLVSVSSLLLAPPLSKSASARRPSIQRRDRRPDREVSITYPRARRKHSSPKTHDQPAPSNEEWKTTPQDRRTTPQAESPPKDNLPQPE